MTNEPAQHDAIYKRFFGEPEMVRSLIEDFLPPALAAELDFSTLERLPAEHVSETLQKRRAIWCGGCGARTAVPVTWRFFWSSRARRTGSWRCGF